MLYYDSAKTLVGGSEFWHHISWECEEWDEDEDDPPLHHAEHLNDVCLPAPVRWITARK